MLFSPLEGVKNEVFVGVILFNYLDLSVTSYTVFLVSIYSVVFLLLCFFSYKIYLIPVPGQFFLESIYKFIFDMVIGRVGPAGVVLFPMVFTIFMFILFANVCGLFPFGLTVTAQVGLTFMLGYSSFIGLTILGLSLYKEKFFKKFLVGGGMSPILVGLLFILEIVSYCVRPLSLSVRLAANMIGGHALLHLLGMMFIKMVNSIYGLGGSWSFFTFVLGSAFFITGIFAVGLLEIGVAILQAYIFSLLLCLYIGEVVRPV